METTEYENGTGGKFRKWPLRRVSCTPYARPPLAARGIYGSPPETGAGVSRCFSKLVDPASRVVVRSASRLLSAFSKGLTAISAFSKDLTAPPGEHTGTFEEVSEVRSSPETREQGENPSVVRFPIHYDGSDRAEQELISRNDTFLGLEELLKQKKISRAEIDRSVELLNSRIIEPSTLPSADYKNKRKINEDSSINSSSSQQAVNHEEREKKKANPSELEGQMKQLVNLRENVTSREHINISEEGFDSPIEIARAYMGLKPQKAAPPTLGLQSQICRRDSPLNLWSSNAAAIAPSSPVCFPIIPTHSRNYCMTQKARGRSTLHNLSCSPYRRSFMMTNSTEYSPYKGNNAEPTRSLEWTPSLSNIRHSDRGQAMKRGSSERDACCFDDVRRVRQKSCLKDLNFPTHIDTSSKFFFSQEYKHDIDSNGIDNLDCKMPSSVLHVPPHSVETARKILRHLDKLNSSPPNKSSYGKAVVGDASFSKSSISAFHEGSLKIKANNDSTKLLNAQGSRILEEPSSSNLVRITSSASPNKDNAEGEASLMPYILDAAHSTPCPRCFYFLQQQLLWLMVPHQRRKTQGWISKWTFGAFLKYCSIFQTGLDASPYFFGCCNGAPKFQFGSGNSTSYSFTGPYSVIVCACFIWEVCQLYLQAWAYLHLYSHIHKVLFVLGNPLVSSIGSNCAAMKTLRSSMAGSGPSSTSPFFPISENGVFGVSPSSTSGGLSFQFAASSSQNAARNFGAVAASSSGSQGIFSENGVTNFSHKSVFQFGTLDSQATSGYCSSSQTSCSSQIDFAISGVKPFTSSSCFSSSSCTSLTSCSNSPLSPAVSASFSIFSQFSSSSSLSTTLASTPSSSPSIGFAFGMPAISAIIPFVSSSRSILPLASTGTTTASTSTMGFGPRRPCNDQMIVQDISNL